MDSVPFSMTKDASVELCFARWIEFSHCCVTKVEKKNSFRPTDSPNSVQEHLKRQPHYTSAYTQLQLSLIQGFPILTPHKTSHRAYNYSSVFLSCCDVVFFEFVLLLTLVSRY